MFTCKRNAFIFHFNFMRFVSVHIMRFIIYNAIISDILKKSIQIFIFRLHSSSNNAVDGENTAQVNRIMLRRATISSERNIDSSFKEESVHRTNQTFDGLDLSTSRHSTPNERKTYTRKRSRSVATIAKNVSFDLGRNKEFRYNYSSQNESSTDDSVGQFNNLGSTQSNSGVDNWLNESYGQDNFTLSEIEQNSDVQASTVNSNQSKSGDGSLPVESIDQGNSSPKDEIERSNVAHASTENSTQSNSGDDNSLAESVGLDSFTLSEIERNNDVHATTADSNHSSSGDESSPDELVGEDILNPPRGVQRSNDAHGTTRPRNAR